ncbi:hypothetical protein KY290_024829 [Solanum tuberosum]|uniref:caffeoyl-CoA O-methyltransferase n=1 Tax=Solanum tuberosum TaxID=4113 RepID=A0ABQ7URT8_SOLTU|nr:hypothetical protein KY284_023681 [Solanum tuberosum]KAH0754559.1 hypothetical protein KY290_024829 [Solanum tuberosum]
MATAPEAAQLIALLLKLINAKKTIEIGVFTGYSLLLKIPDDGKASASQFYTTKFDYSYVDLDRDAYEMGFPVIKKANDEHKINFIQSPALSALDELLNDHDNRGSFDFAFIDTDKVSYQKYH